jgi:hypothetical protein
MKSKTCKIFLSLFLIEGCGALIDYLLIPSESGSTRFLHQSTPRLMLAGAMLILILLSLGLWIRFLHRPEAGNRLAERLEQTLTVNNHLHLFQEIFFWTFVTCINFFFLTFIAFPPFLRPLFIWGGLTCLQGWLCLRITYAEKYLPWRQKIRNKWRSYSGTQQKVFLIMAAIGLVYFCAFIPLNAKGWNGPAQAFMSGVDEGIQYPIAVQTLTTGNTFASTVYHVMVNESDVYGHPYVALEALILLPSRLIFGPSFGERIQLNLFLLRQFINVLPIVLALFLLVFMITRFRSAWKSISLYLLLLTIPGLVKFNIRFLHPDAVILLLIVLTLFFLQRDQFSYRKNFYLAAVTCSLAAVIKLWGLFFFLAVAVYLIWGITRNLLPIKKALLLGAGFILVMIATIVISDPSLLVPSVAKELIAGLKGQIANRSMGYAEAGSSDVYAKDFPTWMRFFADYYLQEYFFFFSFACLILGALWGKEKLMAAMILAWCMTVAIFMVNFLAAKSYWYMMELLVPLYPAAFLLPSLSIKKERSGLAKILAIPVTKRVLWGAVALFCSSQFVINLITIATSPLILNYAR